MTLTFKKLTGDEAEEREQMIFNRRYASEKYDEGHGVCRFERIAYDTVKELLAKGYLDPEDHQNLSPTALEFISFVENHNPDKWYFHGYAVSPERDDVRTTIEGIGSYEPLGTEDLFDFLDFCRLADELIVDRNRPAYCWYD